MNERDTGCENGCVFFEALPTEQKILNSKARVAILQGKEFPGTLNTLCGACEKFEIIETDLENKMNELLNPET